MIITIFLIRLVLQLAIFYSTLSPLFKIILIFLCDFVDGELYKRCSKKPLILDETYQKWDKYNDMIGYLLVYILIVYNNILDECSTKILGLILLYRILGITLYYKTANSKYLVIFVDLFKELFVLFYFIGPNYILLPIVCVLKVYWEYLLHVKKYVI